MLLAAAILGVALIIGHLILVLIRFWGSAPAPMVTSGSVTSTGLTPTPSRAQIVTTPTPTSTPPIVVVTAVPTPIPKPAVEPTAISTPTPTNEQLAKKSLEQAYTDEKKGDYNDAIRDFTEVIRLKPGYQKAYHARGTVYTELKQYEKATVGSFLTR
jgi:tetratricopeptide (TPR) repeat protein